MIPRRIVLALLSLNITTPAGASYLHWPNGSVTHLPDGLMVLAVLGCVAATFWLLLNEDSSSSSSVARMSLDLPEEVREPESVEYYDDMTERTRALKRKLDADTELAESYLKAARARVDLEDIDEAEDAFDQRSVERRINRRG